MDIGGIETRAQLDALQVGDRVRFIHSPHKGHATGATATVLEIVRSPSEARWSAIRLAWEDGVEDRYPWWYVWCFERLGPGAGDHATEIATLFGV